MKFRIIHSEQSDPPEDEGSRPEPGGSKTGIVPPSVRIAAARERLHTRANTDALRARAGLDRLRHTVETWTSMMATNGEAFEDTEPEAGLEMFRAEAFGSPTQEVVNE